MSQPSPIVTVPEAAQMLKVSVTSLRLWIHKEGLPAFRLQGTRAYRLHAHEIRAWLESTRQQHPRSRA